MIGTEGLSNAEASGGMPDQVQNKMENAFGTSFEDVKIHTNSNSASAIGAKAYTQGNNIYFASGQYSP